MVLAGGQSGGAADKRLRRIEDVAGACGVSTRVVYRWIADEGLPVHRMPGSGKRGILRIDSDDLESWLAQYRHNFAEEKTDVTQTLVLEGRRFLRRPTLPSAQKNRLDTDAIPASRAGPKGSG